MDPINQHLKVKTLQTEGFLICALTFLSWESQEYTES